MSATVARDPGRKGRCSAASERLVRTLNRRDAIRLELRHHVTDPARRHALTVRLEVLHEEQDRCEEQLTRLAERLSREGDE